jgi:cation transport regulator ChaC
MNGYELADEIKTVLADAESYYGEAESYLIKCETMLRQQQAEIEKLRSWVEMLVEVPFFNEIDHYRGIPVAILRKASEK